MRRGVVADWATVARDEGWAVFTSHVRVRVGHRRHTVRVRDLGDEYEFRADVPADYGEDVQHRLLVSNRSLGLAYWHIEQDTVWAVSRCPRTATKPETAAYLRATAGLADSLEMLLSEADN